jgi:tRNA dimethylallyltransferase
MKYLLVVGGPTASGKTETAIKLAQAFQTEIISADSRQIYQEMTIGTAVPSEAELMKIKHHFIHHISVRQNYDVATYEKEVMLVLEKLFANKDVVVLTGGTGLYIDAVCQGLDKIPEISPEIREKVQKLYEEKGLTVLQNEVKMFDPEYFHSADIKNPRRMQRALEVIWQTGQPFSFFRRQQFSQRPFKVIWTAIETDRQQLYNRINLRVESMLNQGLVEEARSLYPYKQLNALNTVGYKELFDYFDGNLSLPEAVEQIKMNTRRYAKRQLTWLRKNNNYHWFPKEDFVGLLAAIKNHIKADA